VKETSDEKFIEALNRVGYPEYTEIDRFIGERYYFDKKEGFKVADRRDLLRNDVEGEQTQVDRLRTLTNFLSFNKKGC